MIQTGYIRDCASYPATILSIFYDNLDTTDLNDPEVIIKIDISNAFNSTCRALTLDIISGRVSRDYACGIKKRDAISTIETLSNMFGYFAKAKTGGQQGDPLEMLVFNLTIHHLWGRVLSKFPGSRVVAYTSESMYARRKNDGPLGSLDSDIQTWSLEGFFCREHVVNSQD